MRKIIVTIFILNLFFISCQKDFIIDSTTPSLVTLNDSVFLSKIIVLDTTAPLQLDTVEMYTYNYDNIKRLIRHEYVSYSNGIINQNDIFRNKYYFFYNGTDTLPFMQIDSLQENSFMNTENIFHSYQNGKIISDSIIKIVIPVNDIQVHKYVYFANKIIDTFIQYPINPIFQSSPYGGYKVHNVQQQNNNITLLKDSTFYYSTFSNPYAYYFDYTKMEISTFDNFKNPFYKFRNLNPYHYDSYTPSLTLNLDGSKVAYLGMNNPLKHQELRNLSSSTTNYRYEYNSNGYPKTLRVTGNYNTAFAYKILFFYTN